MQPDIRTRTYESPYRYDEWTVVIESRQIGMVTIRVTAETADLAASLAWSRLRRIVNLEPIEGAPIGEGDQ